MSPSPDDEPASTGPPDRQTLRFLERILADESVVTTTEFEPDSYEPTLLRALVDVGRYPPAIETTRLDIRWFTSGDFSMHYIETRANGDQWECRWDRHPNSHNARLHFHQPPTGDKVEDLTVSSVHPLDIVSLVLAAIEQRITQHW
ncbi:hypothetical protein [Saliphagus sp. LR7]|uniref:hypothetical protein n=1 Tax=Saliphagus sp. LR7 TaxID=2282654 RepID=UPI000DF7DEF1